MSKGLEEWKYTRKNYLQLKKEKYHKCKELGMILDSCNERCDIIEKELKEGEKNKQALKVIKNANLNVVYYGYIDGKDVYALRIGEREIKYISQEEYDLLKES